MENNIVTQFAGQVTEVRVERATPWGRATSSSSSATRAKEAGATARRRSQWAPAGLGWHGRAGVSRNLARELSPGCLPAAARQLATSVPSRGRCPAPARSGSSPRRPGSAPRVPATALMFAEVKTARGLHLGPVAGRPGARPRRCRPGTCCPPGPGRRRRSSASSSSSRLSTSTSSGQRPAARPACWRAASIGGLTPPSAAMWLSFTSRRPKGLIRWLHPPPQRTAYFSTARKPGKVFRVSLTTARCRRPPSTMAAVAVAIPERWVTMLRSVRSAASRVSAGPSSAPRTVPAFTRAPSAWSRWAFEPGRSRDGRSPRPGPAARDQARPWCRACREPRWMRPPAAARRPPGRVAGREVLGHRPGHDFP